MRDGNDLPRAAFARSDESADELFYAQPRFVSHIDEGAIAAVTQLYRELFLSGGTVLDLMSSWISHLPEEVDYRDVIGLGLNGQELDANPRLTRRVVQNLNADKVLPLAAQSVDGAAICVSIQYLQDPVAILAEVRRVLRPGAALAISFSNRCFPTKAVAVWQVTSDEEHQRLVLFYLERAGFASHEARTLRPPGRGHDPLWAVIGRAPG